MRIWIIKIGEPIPADGNNVKLFRSALIAEAAASLGHEVVWWTSDFAHFKKQHRFGKDHQLVITNNYTIKLLNSPGFQENISMNRILDHLKIARHFRYIAELEAKPDIILCAMPTIGMSVAATDYGIKNNVPVVLDMRDMWPDIFLEVLTPFKKRWAKLAIYPAIRMIRKACLNATAIVGITPAFVEWGLTYAKRDKTRFDIDFPLAQSEKIPDNNAIQAADIFWSKQGITQNDGYFTICFFGTMSDKIELGTVIEAALQLEDQGFPIRFVLCGNGDNYERYQAKAVNCKNVIFPGWIGAAEILSLMRISDVGLAPYRSRKDFIASIPTKAVELLSAGLPIVSSLKGSLEELLEVHQCGITYENNDVNGLVNIARDLYSNCDKLQNMAINATALYKQKFIAENVYAEMVKHLETIVPSTLRDIH